MKTLKKLLIAGFVVGMLGGSALVSGCAYGGVGAAGEWAVVTRNDAFLFGILRKAYVCKVTPQGLAQCTAGESP